LAEKAQTIELAFPLLISWNALASIYSEFPAPYVVHTRHLMEDRPFVGNRILAGCNRDGIARNAIPPHALKQPITALQKGRAEITYASICKRVGMLFGLSISPNPIKRNELAYRMYLANRRPPRRKQLRESLLMRLIQGASDREKRSLWSKTARLRRESKDSLIARLIFLERTVTQQKTAENLLREEILRLAQAGSR
jgi:hypothetical protein